MLSHFKCFHISSFVIYFCHNFCHIYSFVSCPFSNISSVITFHILLHLLFCPVSSFVTLKKITFLQFHTLSHFIVCHIPSLSIYHLLPHFIFCYISPFVFCNISSFVIPIFFLTYQLLSYLCTRYVARFDH